MQLYHLSSAQIFVFDACIRAQLFSSLLVKRKISKDHPHEMNVELRPLLNGHLLPKGKY